MTRTGAALLLAVAVVTADECRAGRPLNIDDAAPVDAGRWQLETGVAYRGDRPNELFQLPVTFAYGLWPGLEVGATSGGQLVDRGPGSDGVGGPIDLSLTAKWRFVRDERRAFALTVLPTVKLPIADDDRGLGTGGTDTT